MRNLSSLNLLPGKTQEVHVSDYSKKENVLLVCLGQVRSMLSMLTRMIRGQFTVLPMSSISLHFASVSPRIKKSSSDSGPDFGKKFKCCRLQQSKPILEAKLPSHFQESLCH